MRYLGGKARIAKRLVNAILENTENRGRWVEPMVGGAWVLEYAAPHFEELWAGDVVPDLQVLYEAIGQGWEPPSEVSEEEYAALRHAEPSALRAFVGFGCSFGGKWFGGYARSKRGDDFAGAAKRNLLRRKEVFARTTFKTQSYLAWDIRPGDVVYCDPPYANTTGYSAAGEFDHDEFWRWCQKQVRKGADVFVSEYEPPQGVPVEEVWSRTAKRSMFSVDGSQPAKTERLFKVL